MNTRKEPCGCANQSVYCGVEDQAESGKSLLIEFMFIDLTTCDRCLGTDANLDEAIIAVSTLLQSAGYTLKVQKILVKTEEQAHKLGFFSSPTIRINGQDIQLEFKESQCGCCGEIAGEDVDCRVWMWQGQEYTMPPKEMLVDAILRHVYGNNFQANLVRTTESKLVPDNLKRFFAGKENRK